MQNTMHASGPSPHFKLRSSKLKAMSNVFIIRSKTKKANVPLKVSLEKRFFVNIIYFIFISLFILIHLFVYLLNNFFVFNYRNSQPNKHQKPSGFQTVCIYKLFQIQKCLVITVIYSQLLKLISLMNLLAWTP